MKHALVVTHCGSGATLLCRILANNLKIRCYGRSGVEYSHPLSIHHARQLIDESLNLKSTVHNDWYVDELLFNHEFTCKYLYNICKFIYMIRSPQVPLSTLVSQGYSLKGAETYYLFRLRRMCEMAKKSGGILITYEDLISKSALPLLQNALGLKSPLSTEPDDVVPEVAVPYDVMERCSAGYNLYLNFMEKKTGLLRFVV